MRTQGGAPTRSTSDDVDARARLLAGLPVEERRMRLAGIDTALLEGGSGPPLVLLHDPAAHAAKWFRVLRELTATHHVVAPDLPGHGRSSVPADGPLTDDLVLRWLHELITRACGSPPALVGLILGGGIAARFAIEHPDQVDRLVLVDSLGLAPLQPAPDFGRSLQGYLAAPSEQTHDGLWRYCAYDLERLRDDLGELWQPFTSANLERAATADGQRAVGELLAAFGMAALDPEELARLTVPTSLIWGRHDLATPLGVAQTAADRHGWPLHVIDDCADDPTIERPEAFLRALHVTLGRTVTGGPA